MKIKEGFILRKIAGEDIVVPIGNNIADFNGIINLNESAAYIIELLKEETSTDKLIEKLMFEYEIDKELATKDVNNFLDILKEHQMLECE